RPDDQRRRGDGRARRDARQDRGLLRGRSRPGGGRHADAARADHDRLPRRRRRRHRHRDVHADLRHDQQAGVGTMAEPAAAAGGPLPTTDLRRKLRWLIAIRAVISTALLGGATFAQITAPGSFPVDPFFFLIGLTYALTAIWAATLRYADRFRWLVDLQLAGDAIVVSAFIYFTSGITSYFSSLYVLVIVAAATVQFRRGGMLVAGLSAILYGGIVLAQYLTAEGLLHDPWLVTEVVLPQRSVAGYTYLLNTFGFFAVALLSGSLAESVRSTGARLVQASSQIADLQALNQHVIDSLPSGLATTDNMGRVLTFNRAAELITG